MFSAVVNSRQLADHSFSSFRPAAAAAAPSCCRRCALPQQVRQASREAAIREIKERAKKAKADKAKQSKAAAAKAAPAPKAVGRGKR
jgi:large subunit ribosomal protein L24e